MASNVGELTIGLKFDGKNLTASMNGIEQNLEKGGTSSGKVFGGKWAVAAGNLIASGVKKIGSTIVNTMGSAISRVDQINNFPKVMQSLGYSASESQGAIDKMGDALDGLPTSLDDLVGNVQMLTASMGNLNSGTVNATDVGIAFNNMMLAGGQGTEAASRAFTQFNQMLAKGRVDMQSWNTLVEVAPGQMDQLSKSLLGAEASQQDLYKALQDGTVSMDDFNAAMVDLNENGGENFASFADQAIAATGGIGTQIQNIQTSLTKLVGAALDGNLEQVSKFSQQLVKRIANVAPQLIQGFVIAFGALLEVLPDIIMSLLPSILQATIELAQTIVNNVPKYVSFIIQALIMITTVILQALPGLITQIVNTLTNPSMLQMILQGALQLFMAIVQAIPQIIVALAEAIPTIIDNIVIFISNPENIMMILRAGVQVFLALVKAIPQVLPALIKALGALLSSMPRQIIGYASALAGAFGQIMQKGVDKVKGFVGSMMSAAGDLINGLLKGIGNGAKAVVNKIKDICKGALDAVKNFFGIKSPSRVMAQMGDFLMQGFEKGIEDNTSAVVNAANDANSEIMSAFGGQVSTITADFDANSSIERNIMTSVLSDDYGRVNGIGDRNIVVNMTNNIDNRLDAQEIGNLMMTSIRRAV